MRPDIQLDQYESFEVSQQRIMGNIHQYTVTELQPNTTYQLEIRAILRSNKKRVRSSRVTLTVQTPALEKGTVGKTATYVFCFYYYFTINHARKIICIFNC